MGEHHDGSGQRAHRAGDAATPFKHGGADDPADNGLRKEHG